ncbi:MAG: hypothetical protein QW728_07760, partial [Thermoplasmata archaeon]
MNYKNSEERFVAAADDLKNALCGLKRYIGPDRKTRLSRSIRATSIFFILASFGWLALSTASVIPWKAGAGLSGCCGILFIFSGIFLLWASGFILWHYRDLYFDAGRGRKAYLFHIISIAVFLITIALLIAGAAGLAILMVYVCLIFFSLTWLYYAWAFNSSRIELAGFIAIVGCLAPFIALSPLAQQVASFGLLLFIMIGHILFASAYWRLGKHVLVR